MQGPAHLVIGWLSGELAGLAEPRDRRVVGLAALVPDVDVVVYPLAYIAYLGDLDRAFATYVAVHHRYTHGVLFALLVGFVAFRLATPRRRTLVAILASVAVLVHIVCDVIGSGPAWPVYPFAPFLDTAWGVDWSWNASDWRNVLATAIGICLTLVYAYRKRYSTIECFSYRADAWVAAVMHGEVTSSPTFRIAVYAVVLLACVVVLGPLWLYMR